MIWYEFAIPAVMIALVVRLEAVFVSDYWSWLEMFPQDRDEDGQVRQERRRSFWRRVSIPGVAAFPLAIVWPGIYGQWTLALVGVGAAGLLLWPVVFHGLPWGVRPSDWQVPVLYAALVAAFGSSAWLGGHFAEWVLGREGGLLEVLRENAFSAIVAAVLMSGATTVLEAASTFASRLRESRMKELE